MWVNNGFKKYAYIASSLFTLVFFIVLPSAESIAKKKKKSIDVALHHQQYAVMNENKRWCKRGKNIFRIKRSNSLYYNSFTIIGNWHKSLHSILSENLEHEIHIEYDKYEERNFIICEYKNKKQNKLLVVKELKISLVYL